MQQVHFIRLQNKTGEKINLEAIKEDRDSIWLSAIKSYREGFVSVLSQEETLLSEQEMKISEGKRFLHSDSRLD